MKISFWLVGKNTPSFVDQAVEVYYKRMKHYTTFDIKYFPTVKTTKNMSAESILKKEAEQYMKNISPKDHIILLDEKGKSLNSIEFSNFINNKLVSNTQSLIFIVGGAYGFHNSIYNRANGKISLAHATYSHQIIRIMFMEQLYRAFTIIRGEQYHNE